MDKLQHCTGAHVHEGSSEAVIGLLHVSCFPVALSQCIPCINKGRVVFYGSREALLCLGTVVWENIEGLAT